MSLIAISPGGSNAPHSALHHMPLTLEYASPVPWHSERSGPGEMNFVSGRSSDSMKDSQPYRQKPDGPVSKSEQKGLYATYLDHAQILRPVEKETQAARRSIDETQHSQYHEWNRSDPTVATPLTVDTSSPQLTRAFESRAGHPYAFCEDIEEDVGDDFSNTDDETRNERTQTASEALDKKKTKRFRLTHNQTRFLMNEFSRQAHPDAAHRERLSREIPGLSPRQVQVWFQNRRAKLKRLTSQDRDRVLKSRTLPENFDQTPMLHRPYSNTPPSGISSTSPRVHRSSFTGSSGPRPLAVSISRKRSGDDYPISPSSTTSAYGNYFHSPASGAASEILSPTATTNNHFTMPLPASTLPNTAKLNSSTSHPYARSHGLSTSYPHGWDSFSSHRLQLQSPDSQTRSDSLTTSLRSGSLYTENTEDTMPDIMRYNGQQSIQRTIPQHNTESTSLQPRLLYHDEPIPSGEAPKLSQTAQLSDDTRGAFSSVSDYHQMLPLQTGPHPLPQDHQISPFATSFGFDSFYPYAQDNSSTMSLPASYIQSETGFDPPTEFSYNNEPSTSQPGDPR